MRSSLLSTTILCLLLLCSACADTQREAGPPDEQGEEQGNGAASPAPPPGEEATPVSLPALLDAVLHGRPDQPSVLDQLPEPDRVDAVPQQNRHDPSQTDTLRTLYYDGLQIEIYDVTGSGELVESIEVTGSGYRTEEDLHVGSSRQDVEAALGQPDERQDGAYVYHLSDVVPNQLLVHFEGDRVSELEWDFYVD